MDNELEINCPKCLKCGQRMQDTIMIDTWKSYAICKCKNLNCILKKQMAVISDKKCPGCGNEKIEYFDKNKAIRIS